MGIQRIRLNQPSILTAVPLSTHSIEFPSILPSAAPETVAQFRSAAITLLGRLTTESTEGQDRISAVLSGRTALYKKAARAIRDVDDEQLPGLADILVVLLDVNFEEKLKILSLSAGEGTQTASVRDLD